MEVEIKLHLPPTIPGGAGAFFARLAGASSLGALPLGPLHQIALRDVYYDTAEGGLAATRSGLRLRVENGAALVTLKRTRRQEGALAVREEYEAPLSEASLAEVRVQLGELIGEAPLPLAEFAAGRAAGPLLPVLEVVTHRQARRVGEVAILTLDQVSYPGLQGEPFFDIEVEALPGSTDPALLRQLEAALQQLSGGRLLPSAASKLERGLRLRGGLPGEA